MFDEQTRRLGFYRCCEKLNNSAYQPAEIRPQRPDNQHRQFQQDRCVL